MRSSSARGPLLVVLYGLAAAVSSNVLAESPAGLPSAQSVVDGGPASADVQVELIEGVREKSWDVESLAVTDSYVEPAFGFVDVPRKYSSRGIILDRSNPYFLRATGTFELPQGDYRLLLRARGAARLFVDDQTVAETDFAVRNANGADPVPELPTALEPGLHPLPPGCQERVAAIELDGRPHRFQLQAIVGGKGMRAELGELSVSIASEGKPFYLLSPTSTSPLTDEGWQAYVDASRERFVARNAARRLAATQDEAKYWDLRHEVARREWAARPVPVVPAVAAGTPVHNAIDRFIGARLQAEGVEPAPLCDDWTFLRRLTLDTVGVVPSPEEIETFRADQSNERRSNLIDRVLADSRWADHWVGYWQDVLAENPGIVKPELNNTGPFRWWIHESFLDNKPLDRFVTELVMMQGSQYGGGTAGFAMASQNDAPMADKAYVLAKAFMGAEMKCARCHDAPYHPFKQKDTFSLAAMLSQKSQKLPVTSTVPVREGGRQPLIQISLKPGDTIDPAWPFAALATEELPDGVIRNPDDQRERLAAILTSPRNLRFAQVAANRLWKRYLGLGLVEPVDDWLDIEPSHPELLDYLAGELVTHGYDLKHLARLILNSHTYQRAVVASSVADDSASLFASPTRRRLTAEQLVDSLFAAVGKPFRSEELNLDIDGRRPIKDFLNLGVPRRAWEFTSLSNERDRPALSLPNAQSILDVLVTFGWRQSRPNPITIRDETTMALQPLILSNGLAGVRIARLSDDSAITRICLEQRPLEDLVQAVFQRVLTRPPQADEQQMFVELLADGYEDRIAELNGISQRRRPDLRTAVSWSNHLSPEATKIKLELERAAQAGDPPTERLRGPWRERMEDMLWALVNSPEFMFVP